MHLAWELDRAAHRYGVTPWEVLVDRHRAFNLTAMRAADHVRRTRRNVAMSSVMNDEMGIGRVLLLLSLMHEEA
mgnify:FL=1